MEKDSCSDLILDATCSIYGEEQMGSVVPLINARRYLKNHATFKSAFNFLVKEYPEQYKSPKSVSVECVSILHTVYDDIYNIEFNSSLCEGWVAIMEQSDVVGGDAKITEGSFTTKPYLKKKDAESAGYFVWLNKCNPDWMAHLPKNMLK